MPRLAATSAFVGFLATMMAALGPAAEGGTIDCAVMSGGGIASSTGTHMVIGQEIVGAPLAAEVRVDIGLIACVDDLQPTVPFGDLTIDAETGGSDAGF